MNDFRIPINNPLMGYTRKVWQMTDTAEAPEATTPTPKRGRKADPVTEPMNRWKKAKERAEKARAAAEKVQAVHTELDQAIADEQDAYTELQEALEAQRP